MKLKCILKNKINIFLHTLYHRFDLMCMYFCRNRINHIEEIHISFDDIVESFINLSKSNVNSIFDEQLFSMIKELHLKYDAKFTLYVFTDELDKVQSNFLNELKSNSDWLKFGYHGSLEKNATIESYEHFLYVFGYNKELFSDILRFHKFQIADDLLKKMKEGGIKTLLCSDDGRESYGVSYSNYKNEYKIQGITYEKSDIRLEDFVFLTLKKIRTKKLVIFAHKKAFYKFS